MKQWMLDILSKISIEELNQIITKATQLYGKSCKIVAVHRVENKPLRATVRLAGSNAQKLISL